MLFTSPVFFAFFAVYLALHFAVPTRHRLWLIIVGSTIFYAWWMWAYVWIPFLLMAIAFAGASVMERASDAPARKRRLMATLVLLFIPLVFFKYTDFIAKDVLGPFLGINHRVLGLPLPLGVSFVTFTLSAYVIDVYRRQFPLESRISLLMGYVLFFPHLIAGPILRPAELIPQLSAPRRAAQARILLGLAIFTLGLVKKLIFADQIAEAVDLAYTPQANLSGPGYLLAILGFSVQIYCDFSGYTDMALGLARILGVRLPNNFARPYGANSIVEFWRRWHITLSHWLRDYLYIPLGGSRHGRWMQARNVLITMVLGGLWHGANWTFLLWGLLHGLALASVHLLRGGRMALSLQRIPNALGLLITFTFVTLTWIFFRAPDFHRAMVVLQGPFENSYDGLAEFARANLFVIALIFIFFILHRFDQHSRIRYAVARYPVPVIVSALVLAWSLAIAVSTGSSAKFIYFDF